MRIPVYTPRHSPCLSRMPCCPVRAELPILPHSEFATDQCFSSRTYDGGDVRTRPAVPIASPCFRAHRPFVLFYRISSHSCLAYSRHLMTTLS